MLPFATSLFGKGGLARLVIAIGAVDGAVMPSLASLGAVAGDLAVVFDALGASIGNTKMTVAGTPTGDHPVGSYRRLTQADLSSAVSGTGTSTALHIYRGAARIQLVPDAGFTKSPGHLGLLMALYNPQGVAPSVAAPVGAVMRVNVVTSSSSVSPSDRRLTTFDRLTPPMSFYNDSSAITGMASGLSPFELLAF